MLLEKKNAIVYGAGGAVGSAVAQAFAAEGARVFLTGRTSAALEVTADEIRAAGGVAEVAAVDALDEGAVEAHADAVVRTAGSLDISFNAISLPQTGIQRDSCEEPRAFMPGNIDRSNRVSQAWFACRNCVFVDHADRNGSRNIRARAWELWRPGAQSTAPAPSPERTRRGGAGRKRSITASDARCASPSL
ncbi:SDR family NAD(P)-dependent oxidoreductase [Streptomyces sp. NBC_00457]|uniref:SDR family NAD(P)-dependent oxidoreductase n=1 Tax=Streptomyces sp. NBC_00457 TaxID=2975748 RepID=UPI002E222296